LQERIERSSSTRNNKESKNKEELMNLIGSGNRNRLIMLNKLRRLNNKDNNRNKEKLRNKDKLGNKHINGN